MAILRRLVAFITPNRSRLKRAGWFFAKLMLWCVVLATLLVGVGLAYVWFTGQQEAPKSAPVPIPANRPTISKPKSNPNTPVSASVQLITSPVSPGDEVSMTVRTKPEAACDIVVEYDDDTRSRAEGLQPAAADEFGMVTWKWTVEATAPAGTWPAEVTCTAYEKSAVVRGDFEIKR